MLLYMPRQEQDYDTYRAHWKLISCEVMGNTLGTHVLQSMLAACLLSRASLTWQVSYVQTVTDVRQCKGCP